MADGKGHLASSAVGPVEWRDGPCRRPIASIRRSYLRALDQVRTYTVVAEDLERDGKSVVEAARSGF